MTNKQLENSLDSVLDESITSLIRQGKHEEAWNHTLELDDVFRLYYQIQIRLDQFRYCESLELLREAIGLTHNHPDPKIKNIWYYLKLYQIVVLLILDSQKGIDSYKEFRDIPQQENEFTLGMTNLISGLIQNDPTYYQTSIDHLIASEELPALSLSYSTLCHFQGGRKAIELADKAIEIFKQFGHLNIVNCICCLKGGLYQYLGDYKMARLLNTKALEEHTKNNYFWGIANSSLCLGAIAIEEGNISEAIQRLELSSKIFYQYIGQNPGSPVLVEAYRYSGMYSKGLEVSLDMLDRLLFSPAIFERFFVEITLLVLNMDNINLAKELYERFKSIVGTTQNDNIENSLKLCKALILKQSKSLKTSYKAQDMMRRLLQSTTIAYQNRIETIKQLCELLLLEYELYQQDEILKEVQEHIYYLTNIAQEQNLIRLTFESGIISSKLELLKNNFVKAKQILVGLHDYATSNNLFAYERVMSSEITLLDENYQKWLGLVESNTSIREIMEKTNIKSYMTNALKQITDLEQD